MKNYESLSHTRYDCKYHVVFIPKYRRKKIYGAIRRHLGEIFHELAKQKESRILEGHLKGAHSLGNHTSFFFDRNLKTSPVSPLWPSLITSLGARSPRAWSPSSTEPQCVEASLPPDAMTTDVSARLARPQARPVRVR